MRAHVIATANRMGVLAVCVQKAVYVLVFPRADGGVYGSDAVAAVIFGYRL
jgi:hypothetical protein